MITEQQLEQAARYVLDDLSPAELDEFSSEVRTNVELREFLHSLQKTLDQLALTVAPATLPPTLKDKVLGRIRAQAASGQVREQPVGSPQGLHFLSGRNVGWKPLPIQGAFIKLLSLQADRGYAVLLGRLEPGVRYPAHTNVGPEDFYLLTGDLHVGEQILRPGDFHHADAGSFHSENYSVEGCTLLAVLTTDDPLVQFALQ